MSQGELLRTKIYARIDELPTLPHVVPRLLALIESDRSNASEIASAISHDPALTSMILRVANSAYYGFSKEIASLEKAVPLLGFRMVQSLAVSLGLLRTFPSTPATKGFSMEALWIHSVAVGTMMRELGRKCGNRRNSEHRFTIGLLHDIGKLVFDQFFHDRFEQILQDAGNRPDPCVHELERERLGLDHGEAGALLLARWKLPDEIIRPIAVHHQTGFPDGMDPQDTAMLRVADAVAQEAGFGPQGYPAPPPVSADDRAAAGVAAEDWEQMKSYLADARERIHAFFNSVT